jgi:hypothetical protein
MNLTRPHLKVETVWADSDMLELSLTVTNGRFAGQANFYAGLDEASVFAKKIEGFPRTTSDAREYEFGDTNMAGYGGAKISLHCRNGSGHLVVQVEVYRNPLGPKEVTESATVQISTVPGEIDSFIAELLRMNEGVGAVAVLQSAT